MCHWCFVKTFSMKQVFKKATIQLLLPWWYKYCLWHFFIPLERTIVSDAKISLHKLQIHCMQVHANHIEAAKRKKCLINFSIQILLEIKHETIHDLYYTYNIAPLNLHIGVLIVNNNLMTNFAQPSLKWEPLKVFFIFLNLVLSITATNPSSKNCNTR